MDQRWDMFAANPPGIKFKLVWEGHSRASLGRLKRGGGETSVDLLHFPAHASSLRHMVFGGRSIFPAHPVSFDLPSDASWHSLPGNHLWFKYWERLYYLAPHKRHDYFQPLGNFLCEEYNIMFQQDPMKQISKISFHSVMARAVLPAPTGNAWWGVYPSEPITFAKAEISLMHYHTC